MNTPTTMAVSSKPSAGGSGSQRHSTGIDAEFAWSCYAEERAGADQALRAAATVGAARLRSWQASLRDAAGYGAWLQRDAAEIAYFLQQRARAVAGIAELMQRGQAAIEFVPEQGERFSLKQGSVIDSPIQVGEWIDALFACMVTRDANTLKRLLAVDVQRLRARGVTPAPYLHALGEALRALLAPQPAASTLALAALQAADPMHNDPALRNHAAMIASPAAELIARLAAGDAQAFTASLRTALDAHRQYYSLGEAAGGAPHDPAGFLCLSALACAAAAHDRGWPVSVTSDYLPPGLIEGTAPKAPMLAH